MIYFNCTYANLPELAFNVFPIHQYIYIYIVMIDLTIKEITL